MAKVELGPIVQSVRGSIGGCTFRKVGARYYCNHKSQGPVSPGRGSNEHKAILKNCANAWLSLDPAVKQFWERYHALALPRNPRTGHTLPTPYALFLCYQSMRAHCGVDLLLTSVPEPPIFSYGTMNWAGAYCDVSEELEGVIQMFWREEEQVDKICVLCASSRDGLKPSKFQKKIFPTQDYPSGRLITNSNYLIYQKMGYPPGLVELETQTPDILKTYMCSGWGLYNDLIFTAPWVLPDQQGVQFRYPPALPVIYG